MQLLLFFCYTGFQSGHVFSWKIIQIALMADGKCEIRVFVFMAFDANAKLLNFTEKLKTVNDK